MHRLLNPTIHGVLDYLYAGFLLFAPSLLGFNAGAPAVLCYVVGTMHLLLSLTTAYPLGVLKSIPFTAHSKIELVTAIFLVAAPWLFGFSWFEIARNTFVISGVGLTGVWMMTDYRNMRKGSIGQRIYSDGEDAEIRRAA